MLQPTMPKMRCYDDSSDVNRHYSYKINYNLTGSGPMTKKRNNIDFKNFEIRHKRLIEKITPDKKLKCVGFYQEPLDKRTLDGNRDLDCNIIEIITDISIDIESFEALIEEAEYRILEVTHNPDQFHFLVQRFE